VLRGGERQALARRLGPGPHPGPLAQGERLPVVVLGSGEVQVAGQVAEDLRGIPPRREGRLTRAGVGPLQY
jgi:hypothetical protein